MPESLLAGRATHGATALRGGGAWRPTPYQLFGFLFWLLMSLAHWRLPLCCDAGQYAAVVERLKADLLHPSHPTAALPGDGSAYYTPYTLAQALFARLTDLGGWEVVRLAGPLNLLVLLTGLGRLVRVLTPRPWAPVLALATVTLLSGTAGNGLGLMSLTVNPGYPSTFAIGLTFWAWALTGSMGRGLVRYVGPKGGPGLSGYAALGALYAGIFLIDRSTGVGAALGAAALIAGQGRLGKGRGAVLNLRLPPRGRDKPPPAGTLITMTTTALLLTAAWPYFNALTLDGPPLTLALIPLQLALAVALSAPHPWRRTLAALTAAAACTSFLTLHAGAVIPRSLDPVGFPRPPRWPTYAWAAQHIPPGEVVITDSHHATHTLAGHGQNLAAPASPDASLDERERRRRTADVRRYLSPESTRAERIAVVRRYHVRWLLLTPQHTVPEEAVVVTWSRRTGEVLARVGG
ncbi:integral membrane protein [Streptomyces davaonensis JCM 4913]|uniref:Integral membrane protein n=1 Tax=Streptomyces davaonensis (strain DSM 101723 / JCM 4913 / KCC S-0913 / 768) TaxID=1214101 RepID=K4R066_STRDJ|nr:hypothetical protein [Streptomyces davaonensis]CCK29681.1 integral membrane protein [Streptomyces davaonensis JCM 4913]